MAFNLQAIRTAVKEQLAQHITRETNFDVFGERMPVPAIRFELTETPLYAGTFGPNGVARVRARFLIDVGNTDKSAVKRLDDYLSVGTGNGSSVWDALKADATFGGTVEGLQIEPGDYDAQNVTAELLVNFIALKQGANV